MCGEGMHDGMGLEHEPCTVVQPLEVDGIGLDREQAMAFDEGHAVLGQPLQREHRYCGRGESA